MRTKTILLHDGRNVELYWCENIEKWSLDENIARRDVSNFSQVISIVDEYVYIEGYEVTINKASTIRRFYESTKEEWVQSKIRKMINNNIRNLDIVCELIHQTIASSSKGDISNAFNDRNTVR